MTHHFHQRLVYFEGVNGDLKLLTAHLHVCDVMSVLLWGEHQQNSTCNS